MKHIKLFEQFINENYDAHIGIAKFPDGTYHPFIAGTDKYKVGTFGKEGEEYVYQGKGETSKDFIKMQKSMERNNRYR